MSDIFIDMYISSLVLRLALLCPHDLNCHEKFLLNSELRTHPVSDVISLHSAEHAHWISTWTLDKHCTLDRT